MHNQKVFKRRNIKKSLTFKTKVHNLTVYKKCIYKIGWNNNTFFIGITLEFPSNYIIKWTQKVQQL